MKPKAIKAITLIEVLISIAIFSIGILSISYLIIANIGLSQRTQLRSTATMLAKEGIELVYNRRDTNIKKGRLWNCVELNSNTYDGSCGVYFHNPNDLAGSTSWIINNDDEKGDYQFENASDAGNIALYLRKNNQRGFARYSTFSSFSIVGTPKTPFSRVINFKPVYLAPEGTQAHPDKILKVISTVTYKKGSYSGSISLESFIGDTLDTIALDPYTNQ